MVPQTSPPVAEHIESHEQRIAGAGTVRSQRGRDVQTLVAKEEGGSEQGRSDRLGHNDFDRVLDKLRRSFTSEQAQRGLRNPFDRQISQGAVQAGSQQPFWDGLRKQGEDMSGLYSSRWAATPPADDTPDDGPKFGLFTSRWADLPSPSESQQRKAEASILTPPWADSPPSGAPNPSIDVAKELSLDEISRSLNINEDTAVNDDSANQAGRDAHAFAKAQADMPAASARPIMKSQESTDLPLVGAQQHRSPSKKKTSTSSINGTPLSPSKIRHSPARSKKKVIWRGKTCVVSIPNVNYEALGRPKPLSFEENQSRLDAVAEAYSEASGSDLSHASYTSGFPVHSRPIYPDDDEWNEGEGQRATKVMLPDLAKWKAYMDRLTEQKLAALGVSIGDEAPQISPVPAMSRQPSMQYPPLPLSPALESMSPSEFGRPNFTRDHTHTRSVASPISPLNSPFGHAHRHSMMVNPLNSQQFLQQQHSANAGLRNFGPQEHLQKGLPQLPMKTNSPMDYFPGSASTSIPSPSQFAALRSDLAPSNSGSPMAQQSQLQQTQQRSRDLPEASRNARSDPNQSSSLQILSPNNIVVSQVTPTLPQVAEEDEIDEGLADDAEDVEEQFEASKRPRRPSSVTYVPPHKRSEINEDIAIPTPRRHQHNISEGLERDILELEKRHEADRQNYIVVEEESSGQTSHSEAESMRQRLNLEKDPLSQDVVVQEATRTHKKTASRLNVAAAPFRFNPATSFNPSAPAFTFGAGAVTQTARDASSDYGQRSIRNSSASHGRQVSSGAFNVAAPEFKSAAFNALPKSEFSFSTPSVRSGPTPFAKSSLAEPILNTEGPSIFGKIEISDFVKPARRSKAIVIRQPEEPSDSESASQSEVEDSEGRLAQSEDRWKRQRKAGGSGDEVPRFAEPTLEHAHDAPSERSPAVEGITLEVDASDSHKEDEPSVDDEHQPAVTGGESIDEAFDRDFDRTYGDFETSDDPSHIQPHRRSTSLSALAKPFEPSFSTASHISDGKHMEFSDLEDGELREDSMLSDVESQQISPAKRCSEHDFATEVVEAQPLQHRFDTQSPEASAGAEPSFAEIDAVMRQLNEAEDEQSVQGRSSISPLPSPGSHPMPGVTYLPSWTRSDAPSPSPRRRTTPQHPRDDQLFSNHDRTDSDEQIADVWAPVNRLNKSIEIPTSDWSADFSANDDEKLQQRTNFLDSHIDNLIGRVLDRRLQPLEESLQNIYSTVSRRQASQDMIQKQSSSAVESDADDEDDLTDEQRQRPISRGRDKKMDQIKLAVLEALRGESPRRQVQADYESIRSAIEDAVARQSEVLMPAMHDREEHDRIHRRQRSELEGRLNQAMADMLEESTQRRAAEERGAESRRSLQQAEHEIRRLHAAAQARETQHRSVYIERDDLIHRRVEAEQAQSDAEDRVSNLEAEHAAARATLEEYRASSNKWRQQIDQGTKVRELLEAEVGELKMQLEQSQDDGTQQRQSFDQLVLEREKLAEQLHASKQQLTESQELTITLRNKLENATQERNEIDVSTKRLVSQLDEVQESSQGMKRRLEQLHADMANAAGQVVSEKAAWKARELESRAKHRALESQVAAHVASRSEIEEELRQLRVNANEASTARYALGQMRSSHSSLDEMVRSLQSELAEQKQRASTLEQDAFSAKQAGRSGLEHLRLSMQRDMATASAQVEVVRAELEGELSKARSELEEVKVDAQRAEARHQDQLEEERSMQREALVKLTEANGHSMEEARRKHESTLENALATHARALRYAVEDKQRAELILDERLKLSDEKLQLFQDKVQHLEGRLEIARSAAQAAAMSAQSRGNPTGSKVIGATPDKVSPQALRESILVLQEQLQGRDAAVEKLQNEVDHEASTKIKARDDEITWLRELLTVRNEELTNIVNTLAQPTFNRAAVRDAAIRLHANLEMEQQEKERHGQNQSFIPEQAIASLSNFATPKAAQLTSAFSKWRSSMESTGLKTAPSRAPRARTIQQAPVALPRVDPVGHLYGLMTPPASNIRDTPSPQPTMSLPPPRLQPRSTSKAGEPPFSEPSKQSSKRTSDTPETPATPLLRSQSYDQDAQDSKMPMQDLDGAEGSDDDNLNDVPDNQPPAFRSLESELEDAGVNETVL